MELIMLVKAVATILTPALPFLLKMTEKGIEKIGEKIGESTWTLATTIWEKLSPKVKSKAVKEVFTDVASNPNDPLAQSALEYNLRKILSENIALARELESVISSAPNNIFSQGKNISNITGTIIDGQIVTGDKTVIQHGDYSTVVEKAQIVNVGNSGNQGAEIRRVKIDLKLPNGKHPTFRWIEKAGFTQIMLRQSDKVTRKWWDPPEYDWNRLNQILMDEINKWAIQGWEVVEHDLNRVWNTERGHREALGSAIMDLVGIPAGITWENWEIHYGATFHVRRSLGNFHGYQKETISNYSRNEELLLKCPTCGLPFKNQESLQGHISNWHTDVASKSIIIKFKKEDLLAIVQILKMLPNSEVSQLDSNIYQPITDKIGGFSPTGNHTHYDVALKTKEWNDMSNILTVATPVVMQNRKDWNDWAKRITSHINSAVPKL